MPQSESVALLMEALAKAQKKFTTVKKTKTGREGNITFKYADLADVLNMIGPCLNDEGIFLSHPLVLDSNGTHLRITTKVWLGEQFLQSDGIKLKNTEGAGKQLGLEVTYARRVDNNAFFGIFPDDDLDAPDLTQAPTTGSPNVPAKTYPPKVDQRPATPNNSPRPNEARQVAPAGKGTLVTNSVPVGTNGSITTATIIPENGINAIPQKPEYIITMDGIKEVKKDNSVTVGGQTGEINPGITLDDVPLFDEPLKHRDDFPSDAPEDAVTFVPLTPSRYEEISNGLKSLIAIKIPGVNDCKFRTWVEFKKKDKDGVERKSFDIPAWEWEALFKTLSDAYEAGDQAVKDLLLPAKV